MAEDYRTCRISFLIIYTHNFKSSIRSAWLKMSWRQTGQFEQHTKFLNSCCNFCAHHVKVISHYQSLLQLSLAQKSAIQVTARSTLNLTQTLIFRRSFGGDGKRVGRGKLTANMGGWDRPMYKFVGRCPLRWSRPCQYPVYFLTTLLIMFLSIDLISLEFGGQQEMVPWSAALFLIPPYHFLCGSFG